MHSLAVYHRETNISNSRFSDHCSMLRYSLVDHLETILSKPLQFFLLQNSLHPLAFHLDTTTSTILLPIHLHTHLPGVYYHSQTKSSMFLTFYRLQNFLFSISLLRDKNNSTLRFFSPVPISLGFAAFRLYTNISIHPHAFHF